MNADTSEVMEKRVIRTVISVVSKVWDDTVQIQGWPYPLLLQKSNSDGVSHISSMNMSKSDAHYGYPIQSTCS